MTEATSTSEQSTEPGGTADTADQAQIRLMRIIGETLADSGLPHERADDESYIVTLPGEHRLKTTCYLIVGRHGLRIEAFVCRKPDENHQQVYAYLLTRNSSMFAVSWSIDDNGDIYLSGRLPLRTVDAEVIDQVLGAVLQYADSNFDTILQLGFGTAIRKEWAWRTKRGESLANLAAFKDFVERGALPDGTRAS